MAANLIHFLNYLFVCAGNFSFSERIIAKYGGAAAMYFVSKKLKKRHNITDERAALYEAVETWVDALKGRQFLGLIIEIPFLYLKPFFWFHNKSIDTI